LPFWTPSFNVCCWELSLFSQRLSPPSRFFFFFLPWSRTIFHVPVLWAWLQTFFFLRQHRFARLGVVFPVQLLVRFPLIGCLLFFPQADFCISVFDPADFGFLLDRGRGPLLPFRSPPPRPIFCRRGWFLSFLPPIPSSFLFFPVHWATSG